MDSITPPPSLDSTPPSLPSHTENEPATSSSSSNPCLDFFSQIVPITPTTTTLSLLSASWQHDPLIALKLVFHLRGVRGTGKSNKNAFLHCASWIHEYHAKTLLDNLHLVAKFGCFKDLLEIVQREVEGREETEKKERERKFINDKVVEGRRENTRNDSFPHYFPKRGFAPFIPVKGYWRRKGKAARLAKAAGVLEDRDKRIAASLDRDKAESQKAAELRRLRKQDMTDRARKKYMEDCKFAMLHDSVAEIFASQLLEDKKALESNNLSEISLACKWAPSANRSYDLRTLMYDAIARRIFRKENNSKFAALDDGQYLSIIRDKMRKEILVPLRRALLLPEVFMSANDWGNLPYSSVSSVARRNYADLFLKHDKSRYIKFLETVVAGKRKVAEGALLPHVLIKDVAFNKGSAKESLAELQWKRMVNDLKESGSQLKSSLAVCDVSASMNRIPLEVCIALGLLVADLNEEPWTNPICTFSENPQFHVIGGESLVERYEFTRKLHWDYKADFQKVLDTLLELAKASELPAEEMVKRVFVFCDMEFDEASINPWEMDYMVIKRKYEEAGYGEPPEIVFWNLKGTSSTPVLATEKGVTLVSGFSENFLRTFLKEGSFEALKADDKVKTAVGKPTIDPISVMQKAISDELFDQLRVLD